MLTRRSVIIGLLATTIPLFGAYAGDNIIYCYGLTEKYEARLNAGRYWKDGPKPGYPGGDVFRTYEDAWQFLVDRNTTDVRRVYGVLADWETDTIPIPGEPTRRYLARKAEIVRIEAPALAP